MGWLQYDSVLGSQSGCDVSNLTGERQKGAWYSRRISVSPILTFRRYFTPERCECSVRILWVRRCFALRPNTLTSAYCIHIWRRDGVFGRDGRMLPLRSRALASGCGRAPARRLRWPPAAGTEMEALPAESPAAVLVLLHAQAHGLVAQSPPSSYLARITLRFIVEAPEYPNSPNTVVTNEHSPVTWHTILGRDAAMPR